MQKTIKRAKGNKKVTKSKKEASFTKQMTTMDNFFSTQHSSKYSLKNYRNFLKLLLCPNTEDEDDVLETTD